MTDELAPKPFKRASIEVAPLASTTMAATVHLLTGARGALERTEQPADGLRRAEAARDLVQGVAPLDGVEAMLAAQLVALHELVMGTARRAQTTTSKEARERLANQSARLAEAFAKHTDALKRWRTGGTQRVVVQHVHAGGQAIGVATAGGRGQG